MSISIPAELLVMPAAEVGHGSCAMLSPAASSHPAGTATAPGSLWRHAHGIQDVANASRKELLGLLERRHGDAARAWRPTGRATSTLCLSSRGGEATPRVSIRSCSARCWRACATPGRPECSDRLSSCHSRFDAHGRLPVVQPVEQDHRSRSRWNSKRAGRVVGVRVRRICASAKNSSKPALKWPRDFSATVRAAAMSMPHISKNIGSWHW